MYTYLKIKKYFQLNNLNKSIQNILNSNSKLQNKLINIVKYLILNNEDFNIKFFIQCLRYINTHYNLDIYININNNFIFIDFKYILNNEYFNKDIRYYYKRLILDIENIKSFNYTSIDINLVNTKELIQYTNKILEFYILCYINENVVLNNNFIEYLITSFSKNNYNLKILDYKLEKDLILLITNNRMKYLLYNNWFDGHHYIKHNNVGMFSELSFKDVIIVKLNYFYLKSLFNIDISDIKCVALNTEMYHVI